MNMKNELPMDNDQLLEQNDRLREQYSDLLKELLQKKSSWLRFLVTTMSVVLGILVSVGPRSGAPLRTSVCFAVGVVLLALGLMSLTACLYAEIHYIRQGMHRLEEEAKKALRDCRQAKSVNVPPKAIFGVLEACGCICFGLALLSLCAYMILCLL